MRRLIAIATFIICLAVGAKAATLKHPVTPGASVGVALSANGDFHRFRVNLKAAAPRETTVVNKTTYVKATDNRWYAETVSWSLAKGFGAHPGWGQTGTAGKIESDDLLDGYEVSTGNPNLILLSLGYHLTVKGKRLTGKGEGEGEGGGTGPGNIEEEWGASFSGVAIEGFDPSEEFEIGGEKSYVLQAATNIIGTTTAGQTVNAQTGNAADAPYRYKLTLESGPGITQPVTLFLSNPQTAARKNSTLYNWNVNELQNGARRWPKGKYRLLLNVTPTNPKVGAPGSDAAWIYVGKPEVSWSGASVLKKPDDGKAYEYFDTTIGADQALRLCAGAVPNDDVHSSGVTASLKLGASTLSGEELVFSFDTTGIDYSNLIPPKLVDGATASSTLTKTTSTQGAVGFMVRSSDLISKPALVARWHGIEVGRLKCDFAAAESKRRFPNQYDPTEVYPDEDTGWLFDFPHFDTPNRTTPAKVYLKFMLNPIFGNIDGNWSGVNGHSMRFYVQSVVLQDETTTTGTPTQLQGYATVVNPNDPQAITMEKSTDNDGFIDGAAQVTVKAGNQINDAQLIYLGAEDQTQWE